MPDQYFYHTLGMEFGPVSQAEIRELLSKGVLGPGDQFRIGMGPWRDVAELTHKPPPPKPFTGNGPSKPVAGGTAKVEAVSAANESSNETRPWVYLSKTSLVGPLTTEQFLKAVQSREVQPKTMVRLIQNSEWIVAEQITGLKFPQGIHEEIPATDVSPVREVPNSRAVPNAEMRHLFAECVSRQRTSHPVQPTPHSRSINTGRGSRLAGGITSAFSVITGLFVSVVEWLVAAGISLVKSRIAWAGVGLLLVVLSIPRISASLVTQGQVLSTLEQTYSEFKDLQAREVDQETWKEFQHRSAKTLEKLTPQLQKNANVEDKISMSLMWMTRDYFPALLNGLEDSTTELESKIELHFATIKDALRQASLKQEKWDSWTISIVGLDVVGVLAALMYFGWKR